MNRLWWIIGILTLCLMVIPIGDKNIAPKKPAASLLKNSMIATKSFIPIRGESGKL